jgi:uncharacterized protein
VRRFAVNSPDPRFIRGLELFNEKDYFESHEVIEELWLETPVNDVYRDLYKGVIQAAAAIYQFNRGIHSGSEGLYRTCLGYLEKYAPTALGLNVRSLIDGMKIWKQTGAVPKVEYDEHTR